ncbi:MAG: SpoVA/SpoVAEb family sporulation membrane protein [Ruminococcus sp.]|nr:SpoVA/SpoVAEb family sporulation membrane protein [Ruminococcus sp.]
MNITPDVYGRMSRRASPKSRSAVNVPIAFATGGAICALGEVIITLFTNNGADKAEAGAWASIILIALSVILTGFGIYHKIAKRAGAGTLVPITGFSNAISSSAIEAKSEGFVLGVGTKIFTIAGPVILYGCSAAAAYGLIYYAAGKLA